MYAKLKISFARDGGIKMTIQDTQTRLQPELITQIEHKIFYLQKLESAIKDNRIAQVYQLLDLKKNHQDIDKKDEVNVAENLSTMLIDIKEKIATFLAPELVNYFAETFNFLTLEKIIDDPIHYDVYLGDWWDHRKIGILNVLSVSIVINDVIISEIIATAKLSEGETLNTNQIQETNKIISGLEAFLFDNTKRSLELQVIEDQLSEITSSKSGLFGRSDKTTREALEKKQELLIATQKRIPEVQQKLTKQKNELLILEKDDALRQLELQAILKHYENVPVFVTALNNIYDSYVIQLG